MAREKHKPTSLGQFFTGKRLPVTLLCLLLIVGIFFRFYDTSMRYSLGGDSTRDGLIAISGASQLQLPLTGAFSSLGPFTFGPWFYYELILFHLLVPVSYSSWILMGILSLSFAFIMYKIGDMLAGPYFGLLTAFFVVFSRSQIATGTELSNPNAISFHTGLVVLLFLMFIRKDISYWWSFLFGLVLGIGINIHYQMSGLLILPVLLLIVKRRRYLYFVTTLTGLLVAFLPLLFFNLNNHWYTVRNMFYYYTEGRKAIYVPNRWLFYARDFWPSYIGFALGLQNILGDVFAVLSFAIPAYALIRKQLNRPFVLLFIVFCFNFLLLRYYWGERGWGYLQFLYPFVFLFTAYSLWMFLAMKYVRYVIFLFLAAVFFFLVQNDVAFLAPGKFQQEMYREAAIIRKEYPGQKIALYNCRDSYSDRVQAVAFLLTQDNLVSDTGRKIGITNYDCLFPKQPSIADKHYDKLTEQAMLKDFYPRRGPQDYATDFSSASASAMLDAGWKIWTPKAVYDRTTRWWFQEQP